MRYGWMEGWMVKNGGVRKGGREGGREGWRVKNGGVRKGGREGGSEGRMDGER